jgi:hypothetical protein
MSSLGAGRRPDHLAEGHVFLRRVVDRECDGRQTAAQRAREQLALEQGARAGQHQSTSQSFQKLLQLHGRLAELFQNFGPNFLARPKLLEL